MSPPRPSPDRRGGLPVLATLAAWSLRNRLLRLGRRLRDPRYAAAFVVGLLYLAWLLAGQWRGHGEAPVSALPDTVLVGARALAPLGLAALVAFWWLRGGYASALAFAPEEVDFLFPAPLTRATLLRYKLLKLQGGVVVSALIFTLVPVGGLPAPLRAASAWLLLTTLLLHQLGSSLVRSAADRSERRRLPHFWVPALLLGLAGAAFLWGLVVGLPALRAATSPTAALAAVARGLEHPGPRWALLPLRAVLAPILSRSAGEWAGSLPGALLLLGAHYLWVIRTDAAFEEVAAHAGRERDGGGGRQGRSWRGRGDPATRRRRLPLAATGEPAFAVAWKNATALLRAISPSTLVTAALATGALFGGVGLVTGSLRSASDATAALLAGLALGSTVFGPLLIRHDLREDLERVDVLRTWPVSSPRLAAAEVAPLALCLTGVQTALLLTSLLLLPLGSLPGAGVRIAGAAAVASPLLLLPLNVVAVTIQSLLAVLFPSWVRTGSARSEGIDQMGRSIINLGVALLLLVTALLPPLVVAGAIGAALAPLAGAWGVLAGSLCGLAALGGEGVLLVLWLGRGYDDLEPDAEGLLP